MTLEDRVHALRLRLFHRAGELGNVSAACREAGVSRSAYYQLRDRFRRYGSDGLHPKHRKGRPGPPPELEAVVGRSILADAQFSAHPPAASAKRPLVRADDV